MKNRSFLPQLLTLLLLAAGLLGFTGSTHAAAITWGAATTMAGDAADVSTSGIPIFAYDWASSAQTVNGVSFTAPGSGVTLANGSVNAGAFSNPTAAGFSTAYRAILPGAYLNNSTPTTGFTVTLNNLIVGHQYGVQWWAEDSRSLAFGRSCTCSSSGGNTVTLQLNTAAVNNGTGQYSIGIFTADATTQSITNTSTVEAQLTALQLRDVTPGLLLTPTLTPPAGTYYAPQSVVIASTAGSTIFYTTDGTTPTTSSSSGASPLTVSVATTMTLMAYATMSASTDSSVASASYTINPPQPPITWGAATTMAGDAEVSTNGSAVFAYAWNNAVQTVNGVHFTAPGSGVTMAGGSVNQTFPFSNPTAAGFSAAYKAILPGAYTSTGFTVTLNNLVVGHKYGVQWWSEDSRSLAFGRSCTITSGGGNSVTLQLNTAAVANGTGQYSIGTFTANATTASGNTVAQKALTVASATANSKLYDGTDTATVSGTLQTAEAFGAGNSGDGMPYTGDTLTLSAPGTFASTAVANGISVTAGTFTLGGVANGNYTLTQPTGLTLTANILNTATWSNTSGGSWPTAGNWLDSIVGNGTDNTADFSTLTLTADTTVTLDGARTIGGMLFDDQNGTKHAWTLNPGGAGPLTLAVGSGSPVISNNVSVTIAAVLAGTQGLTKGGTGTLRFSGANNYTGATNINGGTLEFATTGLITYVGGQINIINGSTVKIFEIGFPYRYDFGTQTYNLGATGGGTINLSGANTNWVAQGVWTFRTNGGTRNALTGGATNGMNLNGKSVVLDVARGTDPTSDLDVGIAVSNTVGDLTKSGLGIATLSVSNNYTGATNVTAGTLAITGTLGATAVTVAANATLDAGANITGKAALGASAGIASGAHLAIHIAATPAAQVTRTITGTLTLTAGNLVDLSAATAPADGTYTLVTAGGITGTPGTGTTLTLASGQTATLSVSGGTSLVLSIVSGGYNNWALQITDVNQRGRGDDPDGDGFTNLQEFLFGTSPVASNGALTTTENSGGNLIIRWNERASGATYRLMESATLANPWVEIITGLSDDGAQVGDYIPRKATIAIGPDKDFFHVEGVEN